MPSTLDQLSLEAGRVLKFFGTLTSAPGGPGALLRMLGWDLPPGVEDVGLATADLTSFIKTLDSLEDAINSGASDAVLAAQFAELLVELELAIIHVRGALAGLAAAGDYLDKTKIKSEIAGRLTSHLAASRIGAVSDFVYVVLQFFGVITVRHYDADPTIYQVEHIRATVDWSALTRLLTDPVGLLQTRYGWGTATFLGDDFVVNLSALLEVIGEPVSVRQLPRRVEEQLTGQAAPEADTAPAKQLTVSLLRGGDDLGLNVGVSFFPLRPTSAGGVNAGIGVSPFARGTADLSFPLTPQLTLEFDTTVALDSGVAVALRPGTGASLKAGLMDPGGIVDHTTGKALVLLTLTGPAPDSGDPTSGLGNSGAGGSTPTVPLTLIALPGGGVVEVASISFGGGVDASNGSLSPSFALKLTGGHASLRVNGADSFVSALVPANGLDMKFDFGVRWSGAQGFTFEGSVSAAIDIPLNLSIAGLALSALHLGVLPLDAGIAFEISVLAGGTIGPVGISLQRLGGLVTFAAHDGNLGPVDLSLEFKPPSGVGLAIDAAGVSGGGFLAHDDARQEYSGVLQLQFNDLALQAFGLITTQVAGGSGYSLLALIDAEFPPVQLGWGFTLNGIGGLLAVHRTADVDALRAALKADKLSTILFPKNAITAAPRLLAELDAIFPPAQGRFLFGPMALIGWGTPTVLTVALAVILELPEPIRIILIARLAALLPSEQAPLIRINMDALGVLDLSQGQLSLDATLFDSKIMGFALTGDMALRADWSTEREFLLAIGGFHPQFTPPTGFPSLNRVAISMPSGSISKLRLAAYLAVTSNTVQFGASLDVFLGVPGFGLSGHLAFDALLQLHPFHFEADISGSVALMAGGDDLMSVSLDATLTGPAPWNIAGSFKIHVIFFDVHKSFSYTWGEDKPQQQIPPVQVLPLLSAALADARNWGTQLPAGTPALVSLRAQNGPAMVAHPLAQLEVHESVAPLGLQITRFGGAAIAGAGLFTITDLQINGSTVRDHTEAVQDDFAPAQFFNLSDEEKLAGPSFERHDAGIRLNAGSPKSGGSVSKTISFETFYVDTPGVLRTDPPVTQEFFFMANLGKVMSIGASARAEVRKSGKQRFQAPGKPVSVVPETFTVTDKLTMNAGAAGVTYSAAKALMAGAIASSPGSKLQIVAVHELKAA